MTAFNRRDSQTTMLLMLLDESGYVNTGMKTHSGKRNNIKVKARVIVSVPLGRCVKHFLDTPLYSVLKEKYNITIISYLVKQKVFCKTYGGEGVEFYPEPLIEEKSKFADALYGVSEHMRINGFNFKYRNRHTRYPWEIFLGDIANSTFKKKIKKGIAVLLAMVASVFPFWKIIDRLFGKIMYESKELNRLFQADEDNVFIGAANWTYQDRAISHYLKKFKVPSIFIPYNDDQLSINGYLIHGFDHICLPGPTDEKNAVKLHGVKRGRIVRLGNIFHRYMEEISENCRNGSGIRNNYLIGREKKIITYMSAGDNYYRQKDELVIIDYILDQIQQGDLQDYFLIYRILPFNNIKAAIEKYRNIPNIGIQIAGNKMISMYEEIDFNRNEIEEFAETIESSSAIVISGFSTLVYFACLFNTPIICNFVELSRYDVKTYSPHVSKETNMELLKLGVPFTQESPEELVRILKDYTEDLEKGKDVWKRVIDKWDFQNRNYKEVFVNLLQKSFQQIER